MIASFARKTPIIHVWKLIKTRSLICGLNHAPRSHEDSQQKRQKSTTVAERSQNGSEDNPRNVLKGGKAQNEKSRTKRKKDMELHWAAFSAEVRALRDNRPVQSRGAEGRIPFPQNYRRAPIFEIRRHLGLAGDAKLAEWKAYRAVVKSTLDRASFDYNVHWADQSPSRLAELVFEIEDVLPQLEIFQNSWATKCLLFGTYNSQYRHLLIKNVNLPHLPTHKSKVQGSIPCPLVDNVRLLPFIRQHLGIEKARSRAWLKYKAAINRVLDSISLDFSLEWTNQPTSKHAEIFNAIETALPALKMFSDYWATEHLAHHFYNRLQGQKMKQSTKAIAEKGHNDLRNDPQMAMNEQNEVLKERGQKSPMASADDNAEVRDSNAFEHAEASNRDTSTLGTALGTERLLVLAPYYRDIREPNIRQHLGLSGNEHDAQWLKYKNTIADVMDSASFDYSIPWADQPSSKVADVFYQIEDTLPAFKIFRNSWALKYLLFQKFRSKRTSLRKKEKKKEDAGTSPNVNVRQSGPVVNEAVTR